MADIDLHEFNSRLNKAGKDLISLAIKYVKERQQNYLYPEHLFLALLETEAGLFQRILGVYGIDIKIIKDRVNLMLRKNVDSIGKGLKINSVTRNIFRLALMLSCNAGRKKIQSLDIALAFIHEGTNNIIGLFNELGIDRNYFYEQVNDEILIRHIEEKELEKKFELPKSIQYYTTNLNYLARQGKLHTIIGRDEEINKIVEILCSKDRPNSVMLLGEAGVGKTALVEYFAKLLEFNSDRFPVELKNNQIISLQLNSLVAGTMYRGMFEERIDSLINELKKRPYLILFVDQAHTLVGAGTAIGAPTDAANILKSVLSYGEVKVIAATTPAEYKRFIMEDEAFVRRFHPILLDEPNLEQTREIVNGMLSRFNQNYSIIISQDAIEVSMELATRYERHLRLPDKVINWLDRASVKTYIRKGDNVVKAEDIYNVISENTKIPVELISRVVNQKMQNLEEELSKRVVGQREAINTISKRIRMNKGPLKENYYRPDGIFLFLGPTGVGKTELAKALAEYLFGNENKMIRVDMSEYQTANVSIEKLIGMPRGFSGSEHGGILTNAIRESPYNVVLLDEIEKANNEILHLFLQVFDEGWLTDGYGRKVYFSDAIIIMTSNLGSNHFRKILNPLGFYNEGSSINLINKAINQEIERAFLPEFINRIDDIIIFKPLSLDEVKEIAVKYVNYIKKRLSNYGKKRIIEEDALNRLVEEGYSYMYGARFLKRKIDERVRIPITEEWDKGTEYILTIEDNNYKLIVH